MPQVKFKSKIVNVYDSNDNIAYRYVDVPMIKRSHCDMNAFRTDRGFGSYANSDMFLGMVERAIRSAGIISSDYNRRIRLDAIPAGVTIDDSGFLATVSFEVTR